MKRIRDGGFNLVEMMVTLAIIGLLSRQASLSLSQSIRQAKTSEVTDALDRMTSAAIAYRAAERLDANARPLPRQFPATQDYTPEAACCDFANLHCPADAASFATPTWTALSFALDQDHYYQYGFESDGTGDEATFAAVARGDLDCDGIRATYVREGSMSPEGDVHTTATYIAGGVAPNE